MRPRLFALFISAFLANALAHAIERDDQTNAKLVKLRDAGVSITSRGCGKSGQVKTESIANKHDPKLIDQMQTTICPGLEIRHYIAYVHIPPARIPDSLVLTDAKRKLPLGLRLGMSKSAIERILGTPDGATNDSIYYFVPEGEAGGSDGVKFVFKDVQVIKVIWGFHYE